MRGEPPARRFSLSSWSTFRDTSSKSACSALSRRLPAEEFLLLGSVSGQWVSPSSRISAKAFAISRACLRSMGGKLYHMGFRGKVARSTLAEANESRDWRIFADFAQVLIAVARPLYADDPIGVDLDASLYALDSTTIDLCLSLFSWARFSPTQGRDQTAHTAVPPWQYPYVYWDFRRQGARCQNA